MSLENGFLPVNMAEVEELGLKQLDFVYVSGDAYVDHPSFGHAIITRLLQAHGYSVGIIAQPDWKDDASITVLGEPRLGFLVSSGNMDSMVNHYYVSKKHRESDAYTPGGVPYKRPDHAVVVYGNLIRHTYKKTPIIIGGIEASLRRMAHYDYWSDSFKRSILLDSQADIISYGMGEKSIIEIADALNSGIDVKDIGFIPGTVYKTKDISGLYDYELLPSYTDMAADKTLYAKSFKVQHENTDPFNGKILVEPYPNGVYVVQNVPQTPLSMQEMDDVYALPYVRNYHPMYEKDGGVPAIREIKFSLISNRGCFGGCNFCALTFHQGRTIQVRSHKSIIEEAKLITEDPEFKGYIHDVGGPTANFRQPSCQKQLKVGVCKHRQCLCPKPCPNLEVDHSDYLSLLRKLRKLPKVKKVFVRSGIRFDYLLLDKDDTFFRELVEYHISGQLKVAPEHICDSVLKLMGKPENQVYEKFAKAYRNMNKKLGKKQYMVPYLMSSHPGSHLKEAIALAEYIRDLGYMPEQVQDFYPTPGTISTCMYYTGLDPRTMKEVYVPVTLKEKQMQRALIQYRNPENYDIVKAALIKAGREDLIGFDEHCLIPPRKMGHNYHPGKKASADNTAKSKDGRADTRKYTKPKSGKPQNMKSKQFKTDKYKTGKDRPEDFKAGRQKNEKYKTDRFTGKTQERGKSKKKTIRNVHTRKKCR